MSDLISRADALVALKWMPVEDTDAETVQKCIEAVSNLPSAQPEQPSEIQDILNYLDTVLHPIISPEHWNIYSELHDMISTLPSAQQWIPCSERLPKYDETVLVWYYGETRIGYLTDISENNVWILHGSFPFKHDEKKVVAWMELPEPYEVEE